MAAYSTASDVAATVLAQRTNAICCLITFLEQMDNNMVQVGPR